MTARSGSPSSFYALSDDDEDEYDTITQSTSRTGVKLLFSKSKVSWTSRLLYTKRDVPVAVHKIDIYSPRSTYIQHPPRKTTSQAT